MEAFGDGVDGRFEEAVSLFNDGQFYMCHDVLEEMWHQSQDPQRAMLHGMLQCAVAMHHLLNQNHRGAMLEFGEGLNKLRRTVANTCGSSSGNSGSFEKFEREMTAVLDFVYNTQLEHAACSEDSCVQMDGSDSSYQLLGNYGAGEALYRLQTDTATNTQLIEFCSLMPFDAAVGTAAADAPPLPPRVSVPVPVLAATEEQLKGLTW